MKDDFNQVFHKLQYHVVARLLSQKYEIETINHHFFVTLIEWVEQTIVDTLNEYIYFLSPRRRTIILEKN